MKLSLVGFRGALWTALGLAACGPTQATESDGSGSASGESSSGATTSPSETSSMTSSTTTGMYCGAELPDDPAPTDTCANPQPILQGGADAMVPTGFVLCDGGFVHREQKLDCIYVADDTPCGVEGDPLNECASDLDCTASPNGYCNVEGMDGGCTCSYGCITDEDCGAGSICYCRNTFTECVPATCITDADCGGYDCVYDSAQGFACRTPFDECVSDSDCLGADCPDCAPDANACAWTCQPSEYGCTTAGRPLLVDGREVRAVLVARNDWCGEASASIACDDDRARLAAHWRACAAMEHASVASFARFALQLTALGAPPDLLADTARAMLDEVEHARTMFALAAADGDVALGPGALPVAAALDEPMDLVSVAAMVAREACIGETLAAVELAEAALHARAPERAALLRTIADDELRHAALGWR
ncbi:MAG TPA: hypothetical protein VG755_05885, partial [Nannocystaceae bacterium]|nr:hypothetical protein [Nannocystaceae bacterium]